MNIKFFQLLILIGCLLLTHCTSAALKPWEKGSFETGEYRNLLAEMGYKQREIDAKMKEAFSDLFEGPQKIYFEVGDSMAYISDIKNNDVRSEGMSYGMMIAVQFDKKEIFDRLWRWSKHYMQHQEGPMKAYFRWSCRTDGTPNSEGPASDGELYFVTSLIFASNLWGNETGIDYLSEAQFILNNSIDKTGDNGVTPLIHPEKQLITFVPVGFAASFYRSLLSCSSLLRSVGQWAEDGRSYYWKSAK